MPRYKIPEQYGTFYAKGPDGKERAFKGGDVAELADPRAVKAHGLEPVADAAPAKAAKAEKGKDA